jgi:hypothetical protein
VEEEEIAKKEEEVNHQDRDRVKRRLRHRLYEKAFTLFQQRKLFKEKEKTGYHRVSHDYIFQIPSDHSASIHMRKPPYFDRTGYNQWKTKIFGYLSAIHKDLWKIIKIGCEIPEDDEATTPVQAYVLQKNYQALNILHSSVSSEEFDKINDAPTAKDAWDTLHVNHQGLRKVRESRIKTLEDELSLFSMKKDEIIKEMYNRMKKS